MIFRFVLGFWDSFWAQAENLESSLSSPNLNPEQGPSLSVSALWVGRKLRRMKAKKAAGPGGIGSWVIKLYADQLRVLMAHIFNLSLMLGRVPLLWKPFPWCQCRGPRTQRNYLQINTGKTKQLVVDFDRQNHPPCNTYLICINICMVLLTALLEIFTAHQCIMHERKYSLLSKWFTVSKYRQYNISIVTTALWRRSTLHTGAGSQTCGPCFADYSLEHKRPCHTQPLFQIASSALQARDQGRWGVEKWFDTLTSCREPVPILCHWHLD